MSSFDHYLRTAPNTIPLSFQATDGRPQAEFDFSGFSEEHVEKIKKWIFDDESIELPVQIQAEVEKRWKVFSDAERAKRDEDETRRRIQWRFHYAGLMLAERRRRYGANDPGNVVQLGDFLVRLRDVVAVGVSARTRWNGDEPTDNTYSVTALLTNGASILVANSLATKETASQIASAISRQTLVHDL